MNFISFPGLNLELKISRIAFSVFGISIYWYAIFIAFSFIIGILIYKNNDKLYNVEFSNILDLLIYLIPTSIISARVYYILFNLDYYSKNIEHIFNIRNGGLAIYGGIIGAVITCLIFCKKRKISLLNTLDFLVISLPLGQAIGRLGNFVNVEAYGVKTSLPWRMGIYEAGNYIEVHPTFLYELIVDLIIFIVLVLHRNKRKFKGEMACIYLTIYSFARFFIEELRSDSLMFKNIRISQLLSLIIFVTFFTIIVYKKVKYRKNGISVVKQRKSTHESS